MLAPRFLEKTTIRTKRMLMYYLASMNFMFVYTILAYSIAVFLQSRFPDQKNAIFMVGLILGVASFFAFFVDVFWAYLQKIKPARLLFAWAILGLMFTVGIFLFAQFDFGLFRPFRWALFTIVAAFSYGWSFDLYDVTTTAYILQKSKPEELAQNISQQKVAEAIGMLGGLIVGGLMLAFGSSIAQTFLLLFLFGAFLFVRHHFDRDEDDIALQFSEGSLVNWKEVFAMIAKPDQIATALDAAKENVKTQVLKLSTETAESMNSMTPDAQKKAQDILRKAQRKLIDILVAEEELKHTSRPVFSMKAMFHEVGELFSDFGKTFSKDAPLVIFWAMFIVIFFSFWDTMAITFQPIFLTRFSDQLGPFGKALGGVMMGLFVLPIFALQVPFAKMADKYGRYIMVLCGIATSGVSLMILGGIDSWFHGSLIIMLLAGMLNGAGYAAAFSPAQAMFISEQQKFVAKKTGKTFGGEAGAAPLRLLLNAGNVLGQLVGGFIFAFLGFTTGFLMFGILLVSVTLLSLPFLGRLRDPKKTPLPTQGAPVLIQQH